MNTAGFPPHEPPFSGRGTVSVLALGTIFPCYATTDGTTPSHFLLPQMNSNWCWGIFLQVTLFRHQKGSIFSLPGSRRRTKRQATEHSVHWFWIDSLVSKVVMTIQGAVESFDIKDPEGCKPVFFLLSSPLSQNTDKMLKLLLAHHTAGVGLTSFNGTINK